MSKYALSVAGEEVEFTGKFSGYMPPLAVAVARVMRGRRLDEIFIADLLKILPDEAFEPRMDKFAKHMRIARTLAEPVRVGGDMLRAEKGSAAERHKKNARVIREAGGTSSVIVSAPATPVYASLAPEPSDSSLRPVVEALRADVEKLLRWAGREMAFKDWNEEGPIDARGRVLKIEKAINNVVIRLDNADIPFVDGTRKSSLIAAELAEDEDIS